MCAPSAAGHTMPEQSAPASQRLSLIRAHTHQFVLQSRIYIHGHQQGSQASLSRSLASTPDDGSSSSDSSDSEDDAIDGESDSDDSGSDSVDSGSDSDEEADHWEQYREVSNKDDDDRDDLDSAIPENRFALPSAVRAEAWKVAAADLPKEASAEGNVIGREKAEGQDEIEREQAEGLRAAEEERPAFAADGYRCYSLPSAPCWLASLAAASNCSHALPAGVCSTTDCPVAMASQACRWANSMRKSSDDYSCASVTTLSTPRQGGALSPDRSLCLQHPFAGRV